MKKGIIYCAINKINGKKYIGETVSGLIIRKYHHHSNSLNPKQKKHFNSAFYNAIRKYGWDNFEWKILEENINYDNLLEIEAKWIINENTLSPNGYNLKYDVGKKRVVTEELRKRMSESGKKRTHTEKTKQKISKTKKGKCTGYNNGFYGKTHSNETKSKHGKYDQTVYTFKNNLTNEVFKGKIFEFCSKHNIDTKSINTVKLRNKKYPNRNYSYKGWTLNI